MTPKVADLKNLSIVILHIFLSAFLFAQPEDIQFEHLTVNDGLSNNNIKCIFQDKQGFMWFGTNDGLNRFDGYEFKIFQHDPKDQNSISGSYINAIAEDKAGNLWIGTQNGLNRLNPFTREVSHFFHDPQNPNSLSHNNVEEIYIDYAGMIWIGTWGGGLDKLRIKEDEDQQRLFFTHYRHDPSDSTSLSNNTVSTIYEDRSGIMWIGTGNGLNIFDKKKEQFAHYYNNPNDSTSLISNRIKAIYEDAKGDIWIGVFERGLNKLDKTTNTFKRYKDKWIGYVSSVIEDSSEALWFGNTNYRGLSKFNRVESSFFHFRNDPDNMNSISSGTVNDLYVDRSGIIWIGTRYGGINKIDPNRKKFFHYHHNPGDHNSLSSNLIWAIFEDHFGKVWIATWGGGVDLFDPENGQVISYTNRAKDSTSLSSPLVRSVLEDKEGNIWVGTEFGLNRFDRTKQTFTRYYKNPDGQLSTNYLSSNQILCMNEDNDGNLWIGTDEGLNRYDKKSEQFTHYFHDLENPNSIGSDSIWCLYVDRRGILWVGYSRGFLWAGAAGLNKYIWEKDYFVRYRQHPDDPYSLSDDKIISIYQDHSGNMWLGTLGGGLQKFDRKTKKCFTFTKVNGLPSNSIYGILEDHNGNLWLSTGSGISKFDPKTLSFRNYDVSDGLQSNEFNRWSYHKGRSGRFYFGGKNGFNMFYPDSIRDNRYIPPIVITSFKVSGQEIILDPYTYKDKRLRFSNQKNDLSFEFVALNYTNSHQNRYAYKLEGVDEHWVNSGSRRFARYADVPPGDYTFRVKGSNNDGIWNEEGASLKITILPPWWETWWAYFIFAAFIFGTLYGLRRYELSRQRLKYSLDLEHVEAEKLQELDRMKSRFFANISHEFRTPLTLIKGPIERWLPEIKRPEIRRDFEMTQRNTDRLLKLVNQLLDISRLESGKMKLQARPVNIVDLTRQLTMAFESLASVNDIELRFEAPGESVTVYLDRGHYEKIITNLLSNALKFTPAGGEVIVDLLLRGDMAPTISMTDGLVEKQSPFITSDEIASSRQVGRRLDSSRIRKDNNNKGFVEVKITDTGQGIPADHLPHIFDRFYQVGDSYAKDTQGSGIGLSLTKELVELHHGKIEVVSDVGKGTAFIISLPLGNEHLKVEEILDETIDASVEITPLSSPLSKGGLRGVETIPVHATDLHSGDKSAPILLIVEDNPDMRTYIREMLVESYKVIEAEDGQKGFEKAAEIIPDIIISDVMMPEMDGFQFCEKIKTDERTSHIPVILLTAKSSGESKIEGLETGADDYLIKPFDSTELIIRVKNLIEQRRKLRERFRQEITLEPKEIAITSADAKFLQKVVDVVEQNIESEYGVAELSNKVGMSRSQLHRKIRALTDQSPVEFIRCIKLKRAAVLLEHHMGNVSEVAYQVGFNNPAYFAECFRKLFGVSPTEYVSHS